MLSVRSAAFNVTVEIVSATIVQYCVGYAVTPYTESVLRTVASVALFAESLVVLHVLPTVFVNPVVVRKQMKKRKSVGKGHRRIKTNNSVNQRCIPRHTQITLTSYVWEKLKFMKSAGNSEVSGFGISDTTNPFCMVDFVVPTQVCNSMGTEIDGEAILNYLEQQACLDTVPYTRMWVHTHPGFSAIPSSVDWNTFLQCFGNAPWSVMLVLGGKSDSDVVYAVINVNSTICMLLPVEVVVAYDVPCEPKDTDAWFAEYQRNVTICSSVPYFEPVFEEYGLHDGDSPLQLVWDLENEEVSLDEEPLDIELFQEGKDKIPDGFQLWRPE